MSPDYGRCVACPEQYGRILTVVGSGNDLLVQQERGWCVLGYRRPWWRPSKSAPLSVIEHGPNVEGAMSEPIFPLWARVKEFRS